MNPEALLDHADFVHRLARSLVRGDADSDDLVQETWLAAILHTPQSGPGLKAWLSRVVRNKAISRWRRRSRRAARERTVASAGPAASPAEVLEREELRQMLVGAIMELPPVLRDAVVLRYLEDLPPREIAARLDAPVETVKSRIRRGLKALRTDLDGRHGGDRQVWCSLLLPLIQRAEPADATNPPGMSFTPGVQRFRLPLLISSLVLLAVIAHQIVTRVAPDDDPVRPGDEQDGRAMASLPSSGSGSPGSAEGEGDTLRGVAIRAGSSGETLQIRTPLRGRVLCAVTGVPLRATVRAGGLQVSSDPQTGSFVLPWSSAGPLECSARFYLPRSVSPETDAPLDIRLEPEHEVLLSVQTEAGDPVAAAEVRVVSTAVRCVWRDGPRDIVPADPVLGISDSLGQLRVSIGTRLLLLAEKDGRCSAPRRCGISDERIVLVLPSSPGPQVGVRSAADGRPLAGLELRAVRMEAGDACSFTLETGPDGLAGLHLPPGHYRLSIEVPYVTLTAGRGGFLDADLAADEPLTWLLADDHRGAPGIMILDARDRSAVGEAAAALDLFHEGWLAERGMGNLVVRRTGDGHVPLPGRESMKMPGVLTRLIVWGPGFLPRIISDPGQELPESGDLEVLLDPAEQQRTLRVITPDGRPWPGALAVRELPLGLPHLAGRPDADGALGPFSWCGGDIELRLRAGDAERHRNRVHVPARVLSQGSEVMVTLPVAGRIRIPVPVGEDQDIVCVDPVGSQYPGVLENGNLVFAGLLEGEYQVGPRHLVERMPFAGARGEAPAPIHLEPSQTLDLGWNSNWSAPPDVSGRISVVGIDPSRLLVAAVFGHPKVPIRNSWLHPTTPVRADGSFSFPDLSARPSRLVAFTATRGVGESIMAVGPANQVLRVEAGMLRVRVLGVEPGCSVQVCLQTRPMSPVDVLALAGGVVYEGTGGQVLEIGPIPSHVYEILVVVGSTRKRVPVEIVPGGASLVEVTLGKE